jgi:hypothetical protein
VWIKKYQTVCIPTPTPSATDVFLRTNSIHLKAFVLAAKLKTVLTMTLQESAPNAVKVIFPVTVPNALPLKVQELWKIAENTRR